MINLCSLLNNLPEAESEIASGSPRSLLTHSWICLETIIRLYYLRHGFEGPDSYILHGLTVLAYRALDQLKSAKYSPTTAPGSSLEDCRSTATLATKGLNDQGLSYYMPLTVLYVMKHAIDSAGLTFPHSPLKLHQDDMPWLQERVKHVQAQYPVNIVRITDDPEQQRLGQLVRDYAKMGLDERAGSVPGEEASTTTSSNE